MLVAKKPKVGFRVDASLQIGTGHVMRCITLANALRNLEWECFFICRDLQGNLCNYIIQKGYTVFALVCDISTDEDFVNDNWLGCSWQLDARQTVQILEKNIVDLLVVDHYSLNKDWEEVLKSYCRKLMVIDDLANRKHCCDLLLDQTFGRVADDYSNLLPANTQIFAGAHFALIRPEFPQLRQYSLERRKQINLQRLLIFMGGVDEFNATERVIEGLLLSKLPTHCSLVIVMGSQAPYLESVRKRIIDIPWQTEIWVNVEHMANLMAEADLAIGAAGSTTWERCCLGLPTLLATLADNQRDITKALTKDAAVISIGNPLSPQFTSELANAINELVSNPELLNSLSHQCSTIVDGQGCSLIAKTVNELLSGVI
ncbi:UDP-2,4-diacetamido-2,4,6-trideoxy-beta-L-altropyranose hydrolase [Legionella jamestowniensis]|nr:UDP-2,4-diacetamido-2,4,6-trideoxy-beta-L-altropyranose hydrolase [Legionella jamestowniensis]